MGHETLAERILKELSAKDVLRLECTCTHANKACNINLAFTERLWKHFVERDFGTGNS
ncbi:unnamed protein product [Anisakis simplex]|uniref:Uncharacterized protein n=1 Tax=Anisakis simplex TaxID=6269 RepID=A0A3P6Q4D7_ANISI|nr:unnamed protein product [Anisakis simplex]